MTTITLNCGETAVLANAAHLVEDLRAALENHDEVVIDASALTRADISFIQIVEAARIHAGLSDRRLALATPVSGPLATALEQSALLWAGDAADRQFWYHEGEAA